ncbi:hypothetical protein HanPSC8_Chr04g0143991 [Helianthus annuus]|nr:hypothetical protein HanPSC8_Chr04g0143991 [Helianthus annuus]
MIVSASFSISKQEEPLAATAVSAVFFHSIAFFLILSPSSPSINTLTSFSTSSLFTFLSISMLTSHSLHICLQFICWSPENGQHIIGTPADKLSMMEPQPP